MEPINKTRRRKVSLSEINRQWVDETGNLSRLVNQALIHYKYCLSNSIPSLHRRFNPGELDVILGTFNRFMTSVPMYFSDLEQFRQLLIHMDKSTLNRSQEWKTAYRVLSEHTPLEEINALVFLTRFQSDPMSLRQINRS